MTVSPEKKMDPRMKRTRQLIQQAFRELQREKDFEAITVQDIAERATVNRATFYDHFEDKYALLEYCFRDSFHQMLRSNSLEKSTCSKHHLHRLITVTCEFLKGFWGHCSPTSRNFESRFELQASALIYEIVLVWLSPDNTSLASKELRASITSWAIYGAAFQWKKTHQHLSLEEYVRQVMPMITACLNASSLEATF